MTVKDYLDLLKSDAPAPGGGSVSALSAAQGVGLVAIVADLTIGREKYAEYEEVCKAAKEEALKLVSNGNKVPLNLVMEVDIKEDKVRLYDHNDRFIGIYQYDRKNLLYKPIKIFME